MSHSPVISVCKVGCLPLTKNLAGEKGAMFFHREQPAGTILALFHTEFLCYHAIGVPPHVIQKKMAQVEDRHCLIMRTSYC